MIYFAQGKRNMCKTSEVLFLLERILGPQDEEELQSAIANVLTALDKGNKDAGLSYLNKVFGDMDTDCAILISDLLDLACECKIELAELLDQYSLNIDSHQSIQYHQKDCLSTTLSNEVRQYFSSFIATDGSLSGRLSLPTLISNNSSGINDCSSIVPSLIEPLVTTYSNRTDYSMIWEAKHTDESVTITSILYRLQIDLEFSRVYNPVVTFNSVQAQVADPIFHGGNTIVAAPTGAGKTNIALWSIICLLHASKAQSRLAQLVIYVAPLKALVREVLSRLESSLQQLPEGYTATIYEYTGEESISMKSISSLLRGTYTTATVIVLVATPEKLDILTSKLIGEDFQLIRERLALVVFDEFHLLGDHTRGNIIEEIVLRFHRHYRNTMLLALSATMPNTKSMAEFLQCRPENILVFDSSYRSVSLHVTISELHYKHAEELYSRNLRESFLSSIISPQLAKGSLLLFTHTRRDAERLSLQLHAQLGSTNYSKTYVDNSKNKKLYNLLSANSTVLFHHAGLTRSDRCLVEELFSEKKVSVLVSTATLAWGVNLPAHTVVILGTKVYTNSRWEYLSFADILQMAGRAGRPSFDTYGECFIIASPNDTHRCLSIIKHGYVIESSFLSSRVTIEKLSKLIVTEAFLSAHILAEEVFQIIMSSLFVMQLFERLPDLTDGPKLIADLINTLLDCCCNVGLLEMKPDDVDSNVFQYHPTSLAELCVKYYVSPFTVVQSNITLSKSSINSLQQSLLLTAMSYEYRDIFLRADEAFELASLEEYTPIKYPSFPARQELRKICTLLQVYMSSGPCYGATSAAFSSLSLMSDYTNIVASAPRIVGCLRELTYVLKKGRSHWYLNRLYCIIRSRCWHTFLFAREILGNALFKSSLLTNKHIQWIEQLELRKFNHNMIRRLTLDHLSQTVCSPDTNELPDKRQLSYLLKAITGYPVLRSRVVCLHQIEPECYEVHFQCCLVGDLDLLHCPEQIFSLYCLVETDDMTLKVISMPIHLNEELEIVMRFKANSDAWVSHIRLYLGELLFVTSSMRLDLMGSCPNKSLLSSVSMTKLNSNEMSIIYTHVSGAIMALRKPTDLSTVHRHIFIAGDSLYLQQAEMLNTILSFIRDTSASKNIDTLVVGNTTGFSQQIAESNNLQYINTCAVYRKVEQLFTRPTVIVIPSIAEIEGPAGYVLELLLVKLVRRNPNLPVLIISFSINFVESTIVALALFLNAKSFIINRPTCLFAKAVPSHAYTVSASILCDDPSVKGNVYEALHVIDDDPEISLLTPFFFDQLLMMCTTSGTICLNTHNCDDSIVEHAYSQCLKSRLHTGDGLLMLLSEYVQDLYIRGFDYVAENIMTVTMPQSYLYFSFSIIPGQYIDCKTMINYHPKPGKQDYADQEDITLDALSNWISEELIAIEKNAITLFQAQQKGNNEIQYADCGYSCISMAIARLYSNSESDREQLITSPWFLALSQSIHSLNLLSLCASRIYDDDLVAYIYCEKALSFQKESDINRTILTILTDMISGNAESRTYALLVTLTSLVIRINENKDKSVRTLDLLSKKLKNFLAVVCYVL